MLVPFTLTSIGAVVLGAKVALTLVRLLIDTLQVPMPVHAPSQPVNVDPPLAAAVSTTAVPAEYVCRQFPGQLIPAGAVVTVPAPDPALDTISAGGDVGDGDTEFEAADSGPTPIPFVACTEQAYGVPLVSPETVTGLASPVPTTDAPAGGTHIAVYPAIVDPPSLDGTVNVTNTFVLPAVAAITVGAVSGGWLAVNAAMPSRGLPDTVAKFAAMNTRSPFREPAILEFPRLVAFGVIGVGVGFQPISRRPVAST